jgi:hypothetical protein
VTEQLDQLSLSVCRLALDPVRGRIRHQHQVGIAVRAALFAELIADGRLVGGRWPEPVGESDTGNPLPDAVHRAVAARGPAAWKRWYSHVEADRTAATEALLASGRWRLQDGRLVDEDAGSTVTEQQRVRALLAARTPPEELPVSLLVLLVGGYGVGGSRPAPRRSHKLVKSWLEPQLRTFGRAGDATVASMTAALVAMRRANTIPLLSR